MYLSKSRPLFLWSCLPFTNTCLSQRPPFRQLPPITGDRPQAPVVPPNQVAKQVSLSKWWLAMVLHRWSQSTVGAFTVGRQTEALPRLSDIACRKVYTDRRLKRHLSPIDVAKSSIQVVKGVSWRCSSGMSSLFLLLTLVCWGITVVSRQNLHTDARPCNWWYKQCFSKFGLQALSGVNAFFIFRRTTFTQVPNLTNCRI